MLIISTLFSTAKLYLNLYVRICCLHKGIKFYIKFQAVAEKTAKNSRGKATFYAAPYRSGQGQICRSRVSNTSSLSRTLLVKALLITVKS